MPIMRLSSFAPLILLMCLITFIDLVKSMLPSDPVVKTKTLPFCTSDGELGAGNLPEWPFGGGFRSVAGARAGRVQGGQEEDRAWLSSRRRRNRFPLLELLMCRE